MSGETPINTGCASCIQDSTWEDRCSQPAQKDTLSNLRQDRFNGWRQLITHRAPLHAVTLCSVTAASYSPRLKDRLTNRRKDAGLLDEDQSGKNKTPEYGGWPGGWPANNRHNRPRRLTALALVVSAYCFLSAKDVIHHAIRPRQVWQKQEHQVLCVQKRIIRPGSMRNGV